MSRVISTAAVRELEESGTDYRQIGATLVQWVEEDDVRYGVDVSPAELLSLAATYYGLSEDHDTQWQLLQRARAAEGETAVDVEAKMISALAGREEKDAALQLADELRRQGVGSILSYTLVSEALADLGEDRAAMRWLNMGLRGFERLFGDDPDDDELAILDDLLVSRLAVRRRLGLSPDSYDEEAIAMNDADSIDDLIGQS